MGMYGYITTICMILLAVSLFILYVRLIKIKRMNGELAAKQGSGCNLGIRKQAESSLDVPEGEERASRLLAMMGDSFYSLDWQWRFTLLNEKAKADFGQGEAEALIGKVIWDVFPHMKKRKRLYEQFVKVMYRRVMLVHEDYVVETNRWYEFRIYPSYEGISVLCIDISAHKQAEKRLQEAHEQMQVMAYIDGLTGVYNRRYFDQMLEKAWQSAQRENTPLSVILFDIDYFKRFNDRYGHSEGDRCLQQVAAAMNTCLLRAGDIGFRYGGEEFVVLLKNTDSEGALVVARRIRQAIEDLHIPHAHSIYPYVTGSFGTATFIPDGYFERLELVRAADSALYESKQAGRNRVSSCHIE